MTRQAVKSRFGTAGITCRRNKYQQIGKEKLEKLYLKDELTVAEIADIFSVSCVNIRKSLTYHKIPPRKLIKRGGYRVDFLRGLKPNEPQIIESPSIKKHFTVSLTRIAKKHGFKIKIQEQSGGVYKVTRLDE